ncbi:hypothetical protein FEM21_26470 [Flavobacterium seoulense]|uniref:Uncharacterized protein n=2 Tax=Flavobacterium seoulense TaxID=1492738 RepID=A0A066WJZ4_9FLAO|nr:hypothetical protein FEM21_26470 [Flavobacterium seoulense]
MTFGGTTTHYTVSDLSLISKVNLGPDNIRIITPIYKDKNFRKKSYYIETRNLQKDSAKTQEPTHLVEIKIDNSNIVIPENTKMEKISLALAIDKLTSQEKETNNTKKKNILSTDNSNTNPEKNQRAINSSRITDNIKNTEKSEVKNIVAASITKKKINSAQNLDPNNPFRVINKSENIQKTEDIVVSNTKAKIPEIQKPKEITTVPVENKKTEEKKTNTASLATNNNNSTTEEPTLSKEEEPKSEVKNYVSINVVDVYERVAQKGYKSTYMFKEMANSYFFKNQMDKAVKWYGELFAMTSELEPIYYYRYGEALKKTGNLQKGNAMIEKFNKLVE